MTEFHPTSSTPMAMCPRALVASSRLDLDPGEEDATVSSWGSASGRCSTAHRGEDRSSRVKLSFHLPLRLDSSFFNSLIPQCTPINISIHELILTSIDYRAKRPKYRGPLLPYCILLRVAVSRRFFNLQLLNSIPRIYHLITS